MRTHRFALRPHKKYCILTAISGSHFWNQAGNGKKKVKHFECLFSVWYVQKCSSKKLLNKSRQHESISKNNDNNKRFLT